MSWQKVKISYFLKERLDRIKPDVANKMGLNRLEKINFSSIIPKLLRITKLIRSILL